MLLAATTFMLVTFTLSTLVACSSDSENESDMGVEVTYKVTFNSNGGSEVEAQIVVSGEKAEEPTEPTKDGFLFTGWRDENDSFFSFDTTIMSNITLTAEWERITVPSEPQNVKAKASGFRCIDVSWDAVDGADTYVVSYRLSLESGEEDSQENETELTCETTNTYITIEYLDEDKRYDFWVIAKNSIGDSGRSDVVSARQYLPAPTNIRVSSMKGYAYVSFDRVRGATGYAIYAQRSDYGLLSTIFFLGNSKSNINYPAVGLASGGTYFFYVKTICGTKTSEDTSRSYGTYIH